MQVVLRKRVEGLGDIGDVVDVANGYARNYLLPRRLAERATPGMIRQVELEKKKAEAKQAELTRTAEEMAKKIEGVQCAITAKANEEGHLFGAIHEAEIAEALGGLSGVEITATMVVLEEPIRQVGEHAVKVKLGAGVEAAATVVVTSE